MRIPGSVDGSTPPLPRPRFPRVDLVDRFAVLALVALVALVAPAPGAAQEGHHHHGQPELGVVDFQVGCAAEVRGDFDRAVGLLHHMMYPEARQAFESIAVRDPECGMAHWGVAMALFQPLWPGRPSVEVRRRGWEAVRRAHEVGVATERERALLAAAEAFYHDPDVNEWWPRIQRWHDAMAAAWRAHPDDTETAAFYALSVLGVGQVAEDRGRHHARAAEVLAGVHRSQPLHPGAIHYTIHADDIAGREAESLDVVRVYDRIAPSVPHALHMPSHIFVRLGDWPDVIDWNRRSADAALDFPAGDRLSVHYAHGLDYLLYAYLQRGEDGRAAAVLDEAMNRHERYQENFVSAFHLAVMPARFAVERRAWEEAVAVKPRTPDYLAWDDYWWPEALTWFARGLGAAHTGDLDAALAAGRRMTELRDRARAADEAAFATYIEVDRLILSGRIAQAQGDAASAVDRTREAADLELTVEKHVVTPGALLPPNEALGDLLMEQGRPADALLAYERSLEIWPNRYNSLLGAARGARDAGDHDRAAAHYARLIDITEGAGTDRPGVREARDFRT
jgi:tetratricopeptide (TPR) repeat protein